MGIVMNHVKTIFPATSHLTSRNRLGSDPQNSRGDHMGRADRKTGHGGRMTEAEVGGNSVGGFDLEDFEPIVAVIFQPPKEVPSPIAAAETLTPAELKSD